MYRYDGVYKTRFKTKKIFYGRIFVLYLRRPIHYQNRDFFSLAYFYQKDNCVKIDAINFLIQITTCFKKRDTIESAKYIYIFIYI